MTLSSSVMYLLSIVKSLVAAAATSAENYFNCRSHHTTLIHPPVHFVQCLGRSVVKAAVIIMLSILFLFAFDCFSYWLVCSYCWCITGFCKYLNSHECQCALYEDERFAFNDGLCTAAQHRVNYLRWLALLTEIRVTEIIFIIMVNSVQFTSSHISHNKQRTKQADNKPHHYEMLAFGFCCCSTSFVICTLRFVQLNLAVSDFQLCTAFKPCRIVRWYVLH